MVLTDTPYDAFTTVASIHVDRFVSSERGELAKRLGPPEPKLTLGVDLPDVGATVMNHGTPPRIWLSFRPRWQG